MMNHTYAQIQDDLKVVRVTRRLVIHVGVCADYDGVVEVRHPFQTSHARQKGRVRVYFDVDKTGGNDASARALGKAVPHRMGGTVP